jgi:putative acetyltransferase
MSERQMVEILAVEGRATRRYLPEIRTLFEEYAESLDFDLCFQNFDEELAELPGPYRKPRGRLYLALYGGNPAGCIALRPLEAGICEVKRLYVRPAFRRMGIGRALSELLIDEAKAADYLRMRLDSIDSMSAAIALYRSLGFQEIPAYRHNPIPGAVFFELELKQA